MKKNILLCLLSVIMCSGCKLFVTGNDVKIKTFYAKKNETFVKSDSISIVELPVYRRILNYCVLNYFDGKDPGVDMVGPFANGVLDTDNCPLVDSGYLAFTLSKNGRYFIGFNMSSVYLSEENLITIMCHELVHCYYPDAGHMDDKWRAERNRLYSTFGFDIDRAMDGNIKKYEDY